MSIESSNVLLAMADERAADRVAECLAPPHAVRTAATGDAAMDVLGTGRVDVLVVSRLLPDYGAEALLREVRYRELACSVVIVDDDADIERVDAGVDARLVRPFTGADLRRVVGTVATRAPRERRPEPATAPTGGGEAS